MVKLKGIEGAKQASGLVIIVDILRAATVEACAFYKGARYIIPVATKEEAFSIKEKSPEFLLIGEEGGYKIKGFDYGNSPSEILNANIKDRILIHRSSSGTRGLNNAFDAEELIFGSFVIASSLVKYIQQKSPEVVSIVAMDAEDNIFSDYLEKAIKGEIIDKEQVRKDLYNHPASAWFIDPSKSDFPNDDINIVLDFDKFNFICLVNKTASGLKTIKHQI